MAKCFNCESTIAFHGNTIVECVNCRMRNAIDSRDSVFDGRVKVRPALKGERNKPPKPVEGHYAET